MNCIIKFQVIFPPDIPAKPPFRRAIQSLLPPPACLYTPRVFTLFNLLFYLLFISWILFNRILILFSSFYVLKKCWKLKHVIFEMFWCSTVDFLNVLIFNIVEAKCFECFKNRTCENIWVGQMLRCPTFGRVKCWGVQHLEGSNVEMSNIWKIIKKVEGKSQKHLVGSNVEVSNIWKSKCWGVQHLVWSNVEVSDIWYGQMLRCSTFWSVWKHLEGSNVEVSNILKNKCFDVQHLEI